MTKRAVIYTRVSTDEQAEHGYSLQTQLEAGRAYAERHAYTVAAELQDDYSGAKLDRPGLDQVRAMIDRGETEAVIVYTSDRLTRNLAHSLILREEWQRAGIELHYVDRGQSLDTAESRLTQNIEAVIAEYEREKIKERTRRGKIAKAKAGKWVGDGNTPYGYYRIGKSHEAKLAIDEREAAIVRRIFAMYSGLNGCSPVALSKIAETLTAEGIEPPNRAKGMGLKGKGWYKFTLHAILRRRAYVGEFHYAENAFYLPNMALIDNETWEAAQRRLEKNKARAKRNRKHKYLLSNHLRCICGGTLTGKAEGYQNKHLSLYYACSRRLKDTHLCDCRERKVRASIAEVVVWAWMYGLLTDDARLEKGLKDWRKRDEVDLAFKRQRLKLVKELIDKYERGITNLAARVSNAEREGEKAVADAFARELKETNRERDALAEERQLLTAALEELELTPEKEERIRAIVRAIRTRINAATFEQQREMLDLLDFRGQIGYKDDRRGLNSQCRLVITPEFLNLDIEKCDSPSHNRPLEVEKCASPSSSPVTTNGRRLQKSSNVCKPPRRKPKWWS